MTTDALAVTSSSRSIDMSAGPNARRTIARHSACVTFGFRAGSSFNNCVETRSILSSTLREIISEPPFPASIIRRSEEHTSELQSLMRISYAVFCLKKKNTKHTSDQTHHIDTLQHNIRPDTT